MSTQQVLIVKNKLEEDGWLSFSRSDFMTTHCFYSPDDKFMILLHSRTYYMKLYKRSEHMPSYTEIKKFPSEDFLESGTESMLLEYLM